MCTHHTGEDPLYYLTLAGWHVTSTKRQHMMTAGGGDLSRRRWRIRHRYHRKVDHALQPKCNGQSRVSTEARFHHLSKLVGKQPAAMGRGDVEFVDPVICARLPVVSHKVVSGDNVCVFVCVVLSKKKKNEYKRNHARTGFRKTFSGARKVIRVPKRVSRNSGME